MNQTVAAAGRTDIGRVRSTNQDSYLVDAAAQLYIVADGMGGHAGGEIASRLAIEKISDYIAQYGADFDSTKQHPDPRLQRIMADAINHASSRIYERALEEPGLKGMGTTATVAKILDNFVYCAHVGDSRLYLVRCGFLYQLTADHSLVSEQVRAGVITKEEAELHHLRNVITRSVGYQEEEEVDTFACQVEPGDLLLLCSDGLHGKVNDKELSVIVNQMQTQALTKLIHLANERGGEDNITAVIVGINVS